MRNDCSGRAITAVAPGDSCVYTYTHQRRGFKTQHPWHLSNMHSALRIPKSEFRIAHLAQDPTCVVEPPPPRPCPRHGYTGAHRHMLAHTPMAGVLGGSPRTSLDSPQVVLSRLGSSDVNSPNVPVNDFLEKKTIQRTHARDYVQG